MADTLQLPPAMCSDEVKQLFAALDNKARFVGGCVRDALLGKAATDIDVTTPLSPDDVIQHLDKAHIRSIPTGIKHGTVTAVVGSQHFEVTTLRRDVECHGRHAEVEYTDSWEEDAARRDFTMNAMSCDLDGTLYDYFGGREDALAGIVRFVGDAERRVQEDFLRILRFFRFSAYYAKGELDGTALAACKRYAPFIETLSGERIQVEMQKLFKAESPLAVLKAMRENDVLRYIALDVGSLAPLEKLIEQEQASNIPLNDYVRIALLLRHAKSDVGDVVVRWKLSNKDADLLRSLVAPDGYKIVATLDEKQQKHYIRKLDKQLFRYLVYLQWAEDTENHAAYKAMITLSNKWQIPEFPIGGKEVMVLGVPAGKRLGELLQQAEVWWEQKNYLPTENEIIAYIKSKI